MAISAGDAVVELGLDTKKLESGLKGVTGKLDQASAKWGRKMKIAGGVMIGAVAAVGGSSLKMAADFDSAMREVNTMMLLSEEDFAGFSKEVRGLAADMGVDAVEAANALYQAISAGVPKDNAIEFLEIATMAAIGGVTDTTTAVSGMATVLNAFKIPVSEADHVADLMFTTVANGVTTFEQLSASLFQVAPMAATAGISFDTVAAALATMTKQGVPTSVATTQLRQSIQAMIKPTADMKEVIESMGYASGDAMLAELGFQDSLEALRGATEGNNEQLGKMFGSVEGLQAVFALTGDNTEVFTADILAMENATGSATDAFDQMEKTAGRKFETLQANLKDTAMTLGTALMPMLIKLMEIITPIIEKIAAWIEEHPKLATGILIAVGALGGLLLAGGFLLPMVSSLIAFLPILGAAFTAMLGPVGLIVLAIAAVIAIGVLLYKNWDTLAEKASEIWDKIKNVFSGAWEAAKEWGLNMVKGLWEGIKSLNSWIGEKVKGFAKGIFDKVKEGLGKLWPFSPSEAGVDIGAGLTAGIETGVNKTLKDIHSAMQGISDEMLVNPGIPRVGMASATAPSSQGAVTTITQHFEGPWYIREEADVPKLARELERLRQLRPSYG